jgi:hypothetical protein
MPIVTVCAKPAGGTMDQSASSEPQITPKITEAAFRALAFEGVPYAGQLGCRLERLRAC